MATAGSSMSRISLRWLDGDIWLRALVTGIAYLAACRYIVVLNDPVNLGAGFWPGAGISLGALLVSPRRAWPAILAAIGIAEFVNDLSFGYGIAASAWWAVANMVGPLLAAALMRGSGAARLDSVRDIVRLVGFVTLAVAIAGSIGAIGTVSRGSAYAYVVIVAKWAVGDGLGMLTVAPVIVSLRHRSERAALLRPEPVLVLLTVVVVSLLVFRQWEARWDISLPYLLLPPLVWAAVRFRVAGAAVTTFLVAQIANAATAFGYGPFAYAGTSDDAAILLLQTYLATASVTVLVLGARTSEVDAHGHDLLAQHRRVLEEQATARLYQQVLDESPSAVFVKDAEGRYVLANLAAAHMFGRDREAVIGRTEHELLPVEVADHLTDLDDRARRSGIRVETEDRIPTAEGMRTFFVVRFPVVATGRGPGLIAGIATDVSERRDLEHRLATAERLESVGELAGGIAHDFNNLLTVIGGMTQLALDAGAGDRRVSEPLREVLGATDRASQLSRQLLTFARQEPREPEGWCTADEIVRRLWVLLQPLLPDRTTLGFELEAAGAGVPLPDDRLEQLLLNLAVNARDAMPGGGELLIRTELVEVDAALAGAHPPLQPGPHVLIAVADSGIGMAPKVCDRALEPFFTTKPPGQGTGLGLSNVYGSVTAAGGAVELDSTLGEGTTIRMWLPAIASEVGAEVGGRGGAAVSGRGQVILVVEDDRQVRDLLSHQLTSAGYEVHAAGTVKEAGELGARIGDLDLALCDVHLADGTGFDAASLLRAVQPTLEVLFMSGYTERSRMLDGRITPEDHLLHKPFTALTLQRAVAERLHRDADIPVNP